jgi:hypothetical protein
MFGGGSGGGAGSKSSHKSKISAVNEMDGSNSANKKKEN